MTSFADFDRMVADLELYGWAPYKNTNGKSILIASATTIVFSVNSGPAQTYPRHPDIESLLSKKPDRWINIHPTTLTSLHRAAMELNT